MKLTIEQQAFVDSIPDEKNRLHQENQFRLYNKFCELQETEVVDAEVVEVKTSWCDNCQEITGFYLGTTCSKCMRPFRAVK